MIFKTIKHFNHLNMIFDSISDMVFLMSVSKDNFFYYVNANEAAIKGSNLPTNFIGKTIYEVMPKESADTISKKYQEAIDSKDKVNYEAKIYIHDNDDRRRKKIKYLESTVTPIIDKNRVCTHIIAVSHDITDKKLKEKELTREKTRLELIFNHAADAVFTFDKNGDYISVNPGFTKLFGWTEEELINNRSTSIIPSNFLYDYNDVFNQLKRGNTVENHSAQRITKNGNLVDVLSSYAPIMENGQMVGGVAMYKDITEMIKMTEQIRASERQYRLIFDHLSEMIRIVDTTGLTLYASPSHKDILGVSPEFYVNKSILSFAHSDDMSKLQHFINNIVESKESQIVEYRRLHKEGKTLWMETRGTPVLDIHGNVDRIILISRDIGDFKQREKAYKHLAHHDELTKLPNRRQFDERLQEAMANSRRTKSPIAVFTLDCDRFKHVNDTYGHDVGDEVIKILAKRINKQLRENDIVSRMGGDEFNILLEIKTKEDAVQTARRILKAMQKPFKIGKHKLRITTSIGIAFYEGNEKDKEILLKESDVALYEAKNQGKNRYEIYSITDKVSYWKLVKRVFKK